MVKVNGYRLLVIGVILLSLLTFHLSPLQAQRIPQAIEYTEVYDFLEELTTDGVIQSNAAIKPYTRGHIARLLAEAQSKDSLLNKRQREDLQFYLQDYALELDTLPTYYSYGHRHVTQWITPVSNLNLADPSLHILTKNKIFKMRVRPILGMDLHYNKKGLRSTAGTARRYRWISRITYLSGVRFATTVGVVWELTIRRSLSRAI